MGRTGAGKSTISAAISRIVELETGKILIDDVEISKIDIRETYMGKRGGVEGGVPPAWRNFYDPPREFLYDPPPRFQVYDPPKNFASVNFY